MTPTDKALRVAEKIEGVYGIPLAPQYKKQVTAIIQRAIDEQQSPGPLSHPLFTAGDPDLDPAMQQAVPVRRSMNIKDALEALRDIEISCPSEFSFERASVVLAYIAQLEARAQQAWKLLRECQEHFDLVDTDGERAKCFNGQARCAEEMQMYWSYVNATALVPSWIAWRGNGSQETHLAPLLLEAASDWFAHSKPKSTPHSRRS
jgi:hypothetical protein